METSSDDRLSRVETEVRTLLDDVREQVRRSRVTVERMRALRDPDSLEEWRATRH